MISKVVARMSLESTIKSYSRRKYGWATFLALFQTTRVILNTELLLNIEVTFSRTSSGIDRITLWSSMFQITQPLLTISVTATLTLENLSLIILKGWNFYWSPSPHKIMPYKLLW